MTLFEIVALYVALNILILLVLTYLVIRQRRADRIGIGSGGNETLERAIRVPGNFTEYAPMALIGLFAMAGLSAAPIWLHVTGGLFTVGRLLHAFGYSRNSGTSVGRFGGMILTLLAFLVMAGYLLGAVIT